MVLIMCPITDITPNDFDLSDAKQEVLLAVSKFPKTATEIAKEKRNDFSKSIVFKSLVALEKQKMVEGKQVQVKKEVFGRTIEELSDERYWKPTDKGMVWAFSLGKAHKFSETDLEFLEEQAKNACKK